jgi:hypothetical protein
MAEKRQGKKMLNNCHFFPQQIFFSFFPNKNDQILKFATIMKASAIFVRTVIPRNPTALPGVDVVTTIFCDFRQFVAKKNWRFAQKPML